MILKIIIIIVEANIFMKKWFSVGLLALSLALVGCAEQEEKGSDKETEEKETEQQQETAETPAVQEDAFEDGVDEEAFQKALANFPATTPEKIVTTDRKSVV